jgi:hypothetical protein
MIDGCIKYFVLMLYFANLLILSSDFYFISLYRFFTIIDFLLNFFLLLTKITVD